MFLIAPKDESNGEAILSVENAKKALKKWEFINQLRPNAANALNLACIYYTIGEGERALGCIDTVVQGIENAGADVPSHVLSTALLNKGMFLRGFGRFKEAQQFIFKAFELDKSSAYLGMAAAEEHLRNGNWAEGWKWHNSVRGTCDGAALACGLPGECKFWDGKDVPSHLLVINEGGSGDRINYTRYLPLLTARGISWSFFCFDELKPFYDRLPWIGPERTIGEAQKREFSPPPSHWTTVFSLAGPLGIDPATLPQYPSPYTAPPNDFKFENKDGLPIVGLCWSANELFQGGLKVRSLTEGQAMRLVCATGNKVHWINMQHGHKMPFPVVNVPFESWQDTSVVLDKLDALVTVDCGTLWLSLAMEKQTAILLTSSMDWKFSHKWSPKATYFENGPSDQLFDAERAIDKLILAIRNGEWPKQ